MSGLGRAFELLLAWAALTAVGLGCIAMVGLFARVMVLSFLFGWGLL
jgi:hypothetical protein